MERGFTLIIPLYNKIKCVQKTLDSALYNHGEYPFKCIIVDDDSTDGSSEIAEEYDIKYPDIFQYVKIKHHGNKTPVYARNFGIKLTDTEYIGFLDADDELCIGFIDRGCTFLDDHPEYSLYGNSSKIHFVDDTSGFCKNAYTSDNKLLTTFNDIMINPWGDVHSSANIYKTELVKKNVFTDVYGEDVVFKYKYVYKNEPIYVDCSIDESVIQHLEFSESDGWNRLRTHNDWLSEIFFTLEKELSDGKFHIYYGDDGRLQFYVEY